MRVLIVGGGGREHALAWKLKQDDPALELVAAPGNPGIAELATCVPVAATDIRALLELARDREVGLAVVGPEAPLAAGIVDAFRAAGIPIFGPTRAAAEIETSKSFAKDLMLRAGIPTARAERHTDVDDAKAAIRRFGAPVVIKASGLAAGKGVVVAGSIAEADSAVEMMLLDGAFGDAGAELLVEEFMEGEELSLFALTDGESFVPMLPAQDHKRLLDGDRGPNTGGMGAYAPVSIGTRGIIEQACSRIISPTLAAMREHGRPFSGLLYAGLMLTGDGPKVVEFNCRFGDPETEAILPLMEGSLLDLMLPIARGESLARAPAPAWSPGHAVTTVVAAPGYPESPVTGATIELPSPRPGVHVFHAGTKRDAAGRLVSSGGRVLAITAVADSLTSAQEASARAAAEVRLEGKQLRRDIGWRDLERGA
ncbi:MAG TPA: phosphoribosylamine--glycine ligase [Gemmatimonadaceae bacterium]|nr:phosphoribosylamine--glycine ligase [Gemmatimonadaceae bacterium]